MLSDHDRSAYETHKEHTFDHYVKTAIRNEAADYFDSKRYHDDNLTSLDIAAEQYTLVSEDTYISDYNTLTVLGKTVPIENDHIYNALMSLPEDCRNIILLYFFFHMTDDEIAKMLHMVRRTVEYHRNKSLEKMKELLTYD